jgi:hypothetical protein
MVFEEFWCRDQARNRPTHRHLPLKATYHRAKIRNTTPDGIKPVSNFFWAENDQLSQKKHRRPTARAAPI